MNKWRIGFWTVLVLLFAVPPLIRSREERVAYMAPRFPREVFVQPTDKELEKIADYIAHQTTGDTAIGLMLPGQKGLIVTNRSQDMRLLRAIIQAMKRREIEVDYVFEDDLMEEAMGVKKGTPGAGLGGGITRQRPRWENGWADVLWPRFLPDPLRAEVNKLRGWGDRLDAGALTPLQDAIRRYVVELHPEYDVVAGGRPREPYMRLWVGPKWKTLWYHTNIREALVSAAMYPADVWRLTEDKIMETIPWIEEVHIYDPEGTDLHFSVTADEAETWAKGAYLQNHLFLYPFQGSRAVFWLEGSRKVVVPKTNGVVAATHSHTGVYPNMKVYVSDGMVTHVEGGGRYKEIWDVYLANEKLSEAQIPLLPHKGFFYLFEISWGANPKIVRDFNQQPSKDIGRSAVFHWGFGVESGNPEVAAYLKQHGLPNDHGLHMQTYFTTYEVKLRGTNRWLKFVDRGRLYHLDDPEVRALASRYGDAGRILKERWVPDMPGINTPGDYLKDYARDPAAYVRRTAELVEKGTYRYLQ